MVFPVSTLFPTLVHRVVNTSLSEVGFLFGLAANRLVHVMILWIEITGEGKVIPSRGITFWSWVFLCRIYIGCENSPGEKI